MKKRIISILSAAAVLAGSVCGISAAETEAKTDLYSPRSTVEIVDGVIKGITEPATAEFLKDQFAGDVTVVASDGSEIADDKYAPSDSTVKIGGEEVAKYILPGDVNMDGKINIADVSAMLKSIAKWGVKISEGAADVDGNGKLSIGDASALLKYIAKWDVKLFGDAVTFPVFEEGATEYKLLANDPDTDAKIAEGIKALTGKDIQVVTEVGDGDKFITVGKALWEKYDFIDKDAAIATESTRAYIDTYGGNIYLTADTDNGILGCINYITNQAFTPELDMNIEKGKVGELGDLETLIRPVFTTVEIEGLKEEHRLLQVTDSHLTTIYEDEETPERRADVMSRLNNWMVYQYRKPSYLYFNEYFNYAEDIAAEGILLSGDITDSPSQSNRDILEAAIDGCSVPSYFVYGNHDWSWNTNEATGDVYHSESYRYDYQEGFKQAVDKYDENWTDYYSVVDKGDYMIVSIDNAWRGFPNFRPVYNAIKAAFDTAKADGKPVILMVHVPFHVQEMHDSIPHITGNGYCITGSNCGSSLLYDLLLAEDTPVKLIVAGHVHANYESMVDGRIPQIVTSPALEGYCRVIDLVPAE